MHIVGVDMLGWKAWVLKPPFEGPPIHILTTYKCICTNFEVDNLRSVHVLCGRLVGTLYMYSAGYTWIEYFFSVKKV